MKQATKEPEHDNLNPGDLFVLELWVLFFGKNDWEHDNLYDRGYLVWSTVPHELTKLDGPLLLINITPDPLHDHGKMIMLISKNGYQIVNELNLHVGGGFKFVMKRVSQSTNHQHDAPNIR